MTSKNQSVIEEVVNKISQDDTARPLRAAALAVSNLVYQENAAAVVDQTQRAVELFAKNPQIVSLVEDFRSRLKRDLPEFDLAELTPEELYRQVIYPAITKYVRRALLGGH